MSRLPEFEEHLERSLTIHAKKNEDYASADDPLQNFHRSAELAAWFQYPRDIAYIVLIGTKLARLANLLDSDKEPNNEPIDDTFLDLLTYVNLWWCDYDRRRTQESGSTTVLSEVSDLPHRISDSTSEGIKRFARRKAEECAGTFIPNRIDAIEPFAMRLESIIREFFSFPEDIKK